MALRDLLLAILNNRITDPEGELAGAIGASGGVSDGDKGAIVTVIEADDINMTNAILVETITTGAGGTWASNIRTGKVAAAFVQYETGGTYYTAHGSPYLQA